METHYLSSFFFFIDNLNVAKLFLLVSAKCKCIAMSHFLLDKSVYRFHSSRFFSNFCIFVFHFVFIKLWRNFYVAFGGHKYSLLPMLESNIKKQDKGSNSLFRLTMVLQAANTIILGKYLRTYIRLQGGV